MDCNANYQTKLRHRLRLESTVSHVLESLDTSISLQETAELSYYSPVHFQAIFSEYLGETFFEYVLRNRLFLAARRLTETHEKLNDLAFLSGFSSQANFTRAFKQWFDMPPAEFRNQYYGHPVSPVIKGKRKRRADAVPKIESLSETTLLACTEKGFMSSRFNDTLWSAVTQLCDLVRGLDGVVPMSAEPIYLARDIMDLTRLENGSKMAAVEIASKQITPDLRPYIYQMPAGLYATFSHQGVLPEQSINVGLFDWIPTSDYSHDWERPILMRSNQLSLSQFDEVVRTRDVARDECVLCDGLGMDISKVAQFSVQVSIPVKGKQQSPDMHF